MTMHETKARVKTIEVMSKKYRSLFLETGWDDWTPGQFVMMRVPNSPVLTRRPFGIVNLDRGVVEICFKVVGAGTQALSHVRPGDEINVLGPLGHGFAVQDTTNHVLVAGGYGIAPIIGLMRKLKDSGKKVSLYYGAKSKDHILFADELQNIDANVVFATEDGSVGNKGMIIGSLEDALEGMQQPVIYACGPEPLMRALASLGKKHSISVQVSMDQYMACGIGVCLGCICKTKKGDNVRACREGPVFDTKELIW